MKLEKITTEAKVFRMHPKYIRVKTNQDHVRTLADVLHDTKEWPFPAIHAQPIPISEEKTIKEGGRYYIIDGHHRVEAAILLNRPVTANIYSALSEVEAISMQVSENAKHGMILDVRSRERALLSLKEANLNNKQIAERTGLTNSTVSRILSGKAGVKAGTDADKRRGSKPGGTKQFNVEGWLKALGKVIEGWGKNRRKIEKFKGFPSGMEKTLDALTDHFSPPEE